MLCILGWLRQGGRLYTMVNRAGLRNKNCRHTRVCHVLNQTLPLQELETWCSNHEGGCHCAPGSCTLSLSNSSLCPCQSSWPKAKQTLTCAKGTGQSISGMVAPDIKPSSHQGVSGDYLYTDLRVQQEGLGAKRVMPPCPRIHNLTMRYFCLPLVAEILEYVGSKNYSSFSTSWWPGPITSKTKVKNSSTHTD